MHSHWNQTQIVRYFVDRLLESSIVWSIKWLNFLYRREIGPFFTMFFGIARDCRVNNESFWTVSSSTFQLIYNEKLLLVNSNFATVCKYFIPLLNLFIIDRILF